jgi:glycogen debranching enzyme
MSGKLFNEGHDRALALIRACGTSDGFLASPTDAANYRRIWGRDGCVIGLAALLTGDPQLGTTFRRTLITLARHQGPHGEIPSNVDPRTHRISYGGTTGRVDADLWFLIGCAEYLRETGDNGFLEEILESVEQVAFLLGAWEFNNRGLLFIPPTGDWADEYIQSGYVLYDQLLYLQAKRSLCFLHRRYHGTPDHDLEEDATRLREVIRTNYWLEEECDQEEQGHIYHKVLFDKGRAAARNRQHASPYWMPFFSPTGYGYRFDGLANVFASLLGVANEKQARQVDEYIETHAADPEVNLMQAFVPVITREDEAWSKLQVSFSRNFKNAPYEYHNGGFWPMVTGFHAASLAARGRGNDAGRFLTGIHQANRSRMNDEDWSFPEFIHGRDHTPGGTRHMGWSAAAAIIGQAYLDGKRLFEFPA